MGRAVKRINGIDVEFRLDGRDELPWVTFVTGIANDLSMWDAQAAAFERDFRVLRYDLRGQGGTQPTPGPYTVEMLVKDLIGLLDGLNIRKTSLVGLGLGGALVQAAAVAYPDRVEKLAPCCCRAKMVPEFAKLWHGLIDTVKKDGFQSIVEPTAQRWFSEEFKAANPAVMDKVRRMIKRTSVQGYLGCAAAFLGLDVEKDLHKIRAPTLYVSGAEDKLGGPPALMADLATKVPRARHVSVPRAAHIANIQNPQGFNQTLFEFLK